ncbi:MAG: relaxase, partial [Betaproteobacteria bacterium]|nr:relaxase [Betaproteobacteria bacterium]
PVPQAVPVPVPLPHVPVPVPVPVPLPQDFSQALPSHSQQLHLDSTHHPLRFQV